MEKIIQKPPIVILGMHRSGTSLLTDILIKAGIHFGDVLENNRESLFFLRINEKILKKCNSTWNDPYRFDAFIKDKKPEILRFMKKELKNFLSSREYWGYRDLSGVNWGWKDPRNTLTIDLWRHFFPKLKVINIYRNPIDVGNSLQKREKNIQEMDFFQIKYIRFKFFLKYKILTNRSPELIEFDNCYKLWEFYVRKGIVQNENVIHIKYEELIENTTQVMGRIFEFLKLSEENINNFSPDDMINTDRNFAFVKNKENIKLYKNLMDHHLLEKLDYFDFIRTLESVCPD